MTAVRFVYLVTSRLLEAASGAATIAVGLALFTVDLRPWGLADVPVGYVLGPRQFLGLAVGLAGVIALGEVWRRSCRLWQHAFGTTAGDGEIGGAR
jgi:hypothetical protein